MTRQTSFRSLARWMPVLAMTALAGGCSDRPPMAPVHGTITLQGQPIGPGTILFVPDAAKGTQGKASVGYFEADGAYRLTTYEEGDGALIGYHHVVITPRPAGVPPGAEFSAYAPGIPPIPAKYGTLDQPVLSAEVKRDSLPIDFNLAP